MTPLLITLNQISTSLGASFTESQGSYWCEVETHQILFRIAEAIKTLPSRVCMITCHEVDGEHDLLYHFDVDGVNVNIKLHIVEKEILSLTPLFKSADWTERELSELYGLKLINHPNPKRLFLDEALKENILPEYIPLSAAMNGSVSKQLWDNVKGGCHE